MNNKIFKSIPLILIMISFNIILNCMEIKEIKYNTENNFKNTVQEKKNVELNYINNIPVYYSIKTSKYEVNNKETDIYLSFDEKNNLFEETGNYSVIYKKYIKSTNKSVFGNSAYFISQDHRIELIGNKNSFFIPGENLGSFSINFWIYFSNYGSNETILKIGSQYFDKKMDKVIDQSINAKISNGKIFWDFNNIFSTFGKTKDKFTLDSFSRITPEKWTNVSLTYNSNTGIIREYINDKEEGVIIATVDGSLKSTVYNMRFDPSNKCILSIAPNFYGALDEFYILKKSDREEISRYASPNGQITSKVIDMGHGGIKLKEIVPEDFKNNNSTVLYYYRYSDTPFSDDDEFSKDIKWKSLGSEKNDYKTVRFFQWKAVLLAGDEINYSPRFKGLTIKYIQNDPPSKPSNFKIMVKEGKIYLKWAMNSESDLKGYKIYYGNKPNAYFGSDAVEGKSPIDIGLKDNFIISGLNENLIYYFTITAYDDNEHSHESEFSEELSARPINIK